MKNWWIYAGIAVGAGILLMSTDVIGSETDIFPDEWDDYLKASAKRWGLTPEMVKAVAANESMMGKYTQLEAIGGTTGIMHIKLTTAQEFNKNLTAAELRNPATDIDYGVRYLRKMWDRYAKYQAPLRMQYAVMAYNGGPGRMDQILKEGSAAVAGTSWYKNMTTYWNRFQGHHQKLMIA